MRSRAYDRFRGLSRGHQWRSGSIGKQFADALSERAQHGVPVHVLLDWMGSAKMDASIVDQLRRSGVQVYRYHPPSWYDIGRLNNRTHRKLLIVDGAVGFTGGVGIAPECTGRSQDPEHWRDSHFKVEGPVVGQMQAVFLDNWIKVSGEALHGTAYFPVLAPEGAIARSNVQQLPHGRQREHGVDVSALDHGGGPDHRPLRRVLRSG